jgi:hypothetical protein
VRQALLLAAALVSGCGSAPAADPATNRLADLESGMRALDRAVGTTTGFIGMGVVDATQPPETIALAISEHIKTETNNCGKPTVTMAAVDVDLTAGCILASTGQSYKGTIHADVSEPTGEVLIALTLDLTVDAQALKGSLEAHVSNSSSTTYKADLTFDTLHVVTPFLHAGIGSLGATIDAMGTLTGKAGALTLMANGVHESFTGCYPDEGNAVLTGTKINDTVTFASDTPQTGDVMVVEMGDAMARNLVLPARTGCPRM